MMGPDGARSVGAMHAAWVRVVPGVIQRLFFAVAIAIFVWFLPAYADARTVVVGVYENAPKIFTGDDGRPAGIFIDMIQHIAKKEGWTLKYVPGTWAEGLERLARGEIDLMPDVAYTPERAMRFSFHSVPALSSWYQIYAPRGSAINSILDLNNKRILVLDGSVQQQALARLSASFGLQCTFIAVADYAAMFRAAARGDADGAVTNRFYGLRHAKMYGLEATAVVFEPSDLYFAGRKYVSSALHAAIDTHLAAMRTDHQSVYYRSLKRWSSEEMRYVIPEWLKMAGLLAGIVLVMSIAGSVVLKRQVNARTRELTLVNQEMEQRIIERTAELAEAKERAEEADRIKSAFLATMSHELRTPLNSIIGFTGIILQGLAGPLNEEQSKQMGMVRSSARHLLSLINDVLDISKIEAGQLTLNAEPYDVRAVVEKAVAAMRPLAEKKGLALSLSVDPAVGEAHGDQRRVEQVLLNLISNAVKYSERGAVTVSVSEQHGYVPHGEGATRSTEALRLSVADTGIGIRPDDMATLFQPFRQIDSGLTRKTDGTGLGLAICRRLAGLMGGEIVAESEFGRGSVFTFIVPRDVKERS